MRKFTTTIAMMMAMVLSLFAQIPQTMSYQAVVRNAENAIVASQSVSIELSILQGSDEGTAVYTETHNATTNANGVATLVIGEGGGSGEQGNSGNGVSNGMEYVDLGLSVKWATCNIGASKPEDYGNYYAWGETATKDYYDWSTYKYGSDHDELTKYCTDSDYGTVDNKTTLKKRNDVAYTTLGGKWRMPTDEEWTELRTQCNWTWVTYSGVKGYKVEASNGNSIFLPAAGYGFESSRYYAGSDGYYWSSSLREDYPRYAWYVYFDSSRVRRYGDSRYIGRSVRSVLSLE